MIEKIQMIEVGLLRHIEDYSRKRVKWLKEKILSEGIWTVPVKIDSKHHLVMDGQHRMEVALSLKLKYVPCFLYDYDDVEVWSLRKNYNVTQKIIIDRALADNIYPYKTAKHRFPWGNDELCSIPIEELRN
tara:strand:- start:1 stop:393 length:393 start_codon:yes stop_codon:yes gene_type:complete